MKSGRIVVALIVVGLILALAFVQVEVPSLNPHEGAIGYTQPKVNSTYAESFTFQGNVIAGGLQAPTTASISFAGVSYKYVAPAPVMRPLWQVILPGSLFSPVVGGGGSVLPPPVITTCGGIYGGVTNSSQTFSVSTHLVVNIHPPAGADTVFTSKNATWTLSQATSKYPCSDGTTKLVVTQSGPLVSYEVGTYYFIKNYGDYAFKVTVYFDNASGGSIMASQTFVVSVTPGSLA
jgi:hypothetical protein